jgi:hypothetical protein
LYTFSCSINLRIFTMSIESLLEDYEFGLTIERLEEFNTRVLSARIDVDDFYFLQALADHYEASRSSISKDVLSAGLQELFYKLPESKRLTIATAAQKLYVQNVKETWSANNDGAPYPSKYNFRFSKFFVFAGGHKEANHHE